MKIITNIKTLRRVSRDVTAKDMTEEIAAPLLTELEMPLEGRKLLGLAAPQFGYRVRMFVMKYGIDRICLVNPLITKERGTQIGEEMCESIPGIRRRIERPSIITVRGLDQYSKMVKYKFTGLDARVACHEIDHLNGRLIIDFR